MVNSNETDEQKAAKISMSVPAELAKFLDQQCEAFGVGRSAYLQLLLEAEKHEPRREFVKKARA
jgi:hypothetical protein